MWWLEWDSNLQPLGQKATNLPMSHHRGVNPGGWGSRPTDFGQGGRGRVINYYYILSCTGKWWLLNRNKIICQEVAINGQFLPGNSNVFKIVWKIGNFRKFAWKNQIFLVKLPDKIKDFRKFALKNQKIFRPDPRPPDFKPDGRRWATMPHAACMHVTLRERRVYRNNTTYIICGRMFDHG